MDIFSEEGTEEVRYVKDEKGTKIYSVGRHGIDNNNGTDGKQGDDIVVGIR